MSLSSTAAVTFKEAQKLLDTYCYQCHSNTKKKAGLNFEALNTEKLLWEDHEMLEETVWQLKEGEMPTSKAKVMMPDAERKKMIDYFEHALVKLSNVSPNDPGLVVMPRLNHFEYELSIQALSGKPIKAGEFLPKDANAGAGFPNVGAAHNVSSTHIEKYLDAAKRVLRHAHVSPVTGFTWSEKVKHDITFPQNLRKELVTEWVVLHRKEEYDKFGGYGREKKAHNWSHADYIAAAWKVIKKGMTIEQALSSSRVPLSRAATLNWVEVLDKKFPAPADKMIFGEWSSLPKNANSEQLMKMAKHTEKMLQNLKYMRPASKLSKVKLELTRVKIRRNKYKKVKAPEKIYLASTAAGFDKGIEFKIKKAWFKINGKNKTVSLNKTDFQGNQEITVDVIKGATEFEVEVTANFKDGAYGQFFASRDKPDYEKGVAVKQSVYGKNLNDYKYQVYNPLDYFDALRKYGVPPKYLRMQQYIFLHRFKQVPVEYLDNKTWNGGLPPDEKLYNEPAVNVYMINDQELRDEMIPERKKRIKELSAELVIAAQIPLQKLKRFLVKNGLTEAREGVMPSRDFINSLNSSEKREYDKLVADLRLFEKDLELKALPLIKDFAKRAWGRAVTAVEINDLTDLYRSKRANGGTFDAAVKQAMKYVLVAPEFLYRNTSSKNIHEAYKLSSRAIAERLSFMLWGTAPDEELIQAVESGSFETNAQITAQAERMLKDDKIRGLALQFTGNWLGFAGFRDHTTPSPKRFKEYTPKLRESMEEEALQFFSYMFKVNRPVTDIYKADYAFLNKELAEFYGINSDKKSRGFTKYALNRSQQKIRGGLFGMGASLTRTSSALRTSPVIRGNWILTAVLGYPLPEPPANVEPISEDETDEKGRSLAEQLADHRNKEACASCHERIDPPGIALEHFDAIGRWRKTYLNGGGIDDSSVLKSGEKIKGLEGLRSYFDKEQDQFLKHLSTKFIGYALGRALEPTDKPLIEEMVNNLKANGLRINSIVKTVVSSKQFQFRRNNLASLK